MKKTLLFLGMAVSMFALGTTFFTQTIGITALVCMLIYVASFAMSWDQYVGSYC